MAKTRYAVLIAEIFHRHHTKGCKSFCFDREEIEQVAQDLNVRLPKNVGDILYSFRYRTSLPESILDTAPDGFEWIITGAGRAKYEFKLGRINRILPRCDLIKIKVPDATPEIVLRHSLSDEQALLTKVRYNRLIDVFLGIAAYSMQNHLRTTVANMGQIEIDELYVGLNRNGAQYIVPVQAKGRKDQLGVIQTKQDIACCEARFPDLLCRPISVQFLDDDAIAMFELGLEDDEVRVLEERHYRLVPADQITSSELQHYNRR